jgi:O-antigen ligase
MSTVQDKLPVPRRRQINRRLGAAVVVGLLIVVVAITSGHASYCVLAAAPIVAWLLWRQPIARLVFIVVGGLLVLLSNTNHLTATKVGYFAGVALALATLLWQREFYADLRRASTIRALLPMTLAIGGLIVVSLPVAHSEHTALSSWLRDSAAYGLAAAVPLFLWDFDRETSPSLSHVTRLLLLVCGTLSGLSLVVQWLGQRGVIATHISLHILPGLFLPGALALFLAVHSNRAGARSGWYAASAVVIPLVLLLAGTRSAIALLLCVVSALFVGLRKKRTSLLWMAAAVLAAAVALAALVGIAHTGQPGLTRLTHRITSIPHTLLHLGSDQSYRLRSTEWHVAWRAFIAHPIVGVGPGHTFVWPFAFGGDVGTLSGYSLDTPVVFLAKFGLIGLVALAFIAFGLIRFLRLPRLREQQAAWLSLVWYLVFAVVQLPFEWPFEQKDFALGLLLLGTLVVQPLVPAFAGFTEDWAALRRRVMRRSTQPSSHPPPEEPAHLTG